MTVNDEALTCNAPGAVLASKDAVAPRLSTTFAPSWSPSQHGESGSARCLGIVNYATYAGVPRLVGGLPTVDVHMYGTPTEGFSELWLGAGDLHSGSEGDLVYAHDDQFLFCAGSIALTGECTEHARRAYLRAFDLIHRLGFTDIFRMWNFIPRINEDNALGLEVYRDFCRGRTQAFEIRYANAKAMSAATGIGSLGGKIVFYLLALRDARVTHLENPRQVPAYHYPMQYGPKSPSFARATHVDLKGTQALFISGTASILGHETVHLDEVEKQCQVALDNIAHLISAQNLGRHGIDAGFTLKDLNHVKVYVRHAKDLAPVKRACFNALAPFSQVEYMQVDICRRDLLVEIEGVVPFHPVSRG